MSQQGNVSNSISQSSVAGGYPAWRIKPEIDGERQKELSRYLTVVPDVELGRYPFMGVRLSRADVEWLLVNHENGRGPVDWGDEKQRDRLGLDLRGADLRKVNLRNLPLARIQGGLNRKKWQKATLEEREMAALHLEGADLSEAHLEGAILQGVHLEGATLRGTHLERANLFRTHLNNAYLREAHLEQARLLGTWMEGAYLVGTHLDGADLRNAFFDRATTLDEGVTLGDEKFGFASLVDVRWSDVNLSRVNWRRVKILGDDFRARSRELSFGTGTAREKSRRLDDYQAAVRANRQLANAMRAQGMNEAAIRFAHRGQVLQRKIFWWRMLWGELEEASQLNVSRGWLREGVHKLWWRIRNFGALVLSWVLDLLAGYGYKPGRSLLVYLCTILGFAAFYWGVGHLPLLEALILSVTSFHGRGLFADTSTGSPLMAWAALEAVFGLVIEISFIATFTQRFFGR